MPVFHVRISVQETRFMLWIHVQERLSPYRDSVQMFNFHRAHHVEITSLSTACTTVNVNRSVAQTCPELSCALSW